MSTVSVETDDGTSVTARCWAVDIVDDGSEPGWDHPAQKLAAVRREEAQASGDAESSAGASKEGSSAAGEEQQAGPGSEEGQSGRAADSIDTPPASAAAGSPPARPVDAPGDTGSRASRHPGGTVQPRRVDDEEASAERDAPAQPAGSESATESPERGDAPARRVHGEPTVDELDVGDLERDAGDADSLAVRLEHLQAKVQSMEVYASVIESFVDAHGTPRRAFDMLAGELQEIRSEMSSLESTVTELEDRQTERIEDLAERLHEHGQRLDRQSSRVDDEAGRIDAQADRLDQHADRLADVHDRLDDQAASRERQSVRLDDHADRLGAQAEQLDDHTDRLDRLEDVLTTVFSLQRAQWKEVRDSLEEVRTAQQDRVDALEHRIDERNREFRRLLAGWITDAELELFEIDQRVRTNESWREQVSAATAWEPQDG